jgi:FkbM family methyltransferase
MFLNQHLKDATVYSFEPIPDTFELFIRNVKLHNSLQLQMYNCGLSDKPGSATFTHYPKTNACSTMYPQGSTEYVKNSRQFVLDEIRNFNPILRTLVDRTPRLAWWPLAEMIRRYYRSAISVECQLRTVSSVVDEHNIDRIDYLKVDTEGAEMHVLKGIRPEHWPIIKQAVIEVHEGKPALRQVLNLLESNGFKAIVEQPCDLREHLHMVYARRV